MSDPLLPGREKGLDYWVQWFTMPSKTSILLIATLFFGASINADPLAIGAALPEVSATLETGNTIDLSREGARGWVLVFFFPKADTPGCAKQACSLRDAYEALSEMGVRIFGVSRDGIESQKKFKEKYTLPFHLIADTDKAVIGAFGVPTKFGFSIRQAYLFKDGKLVWRDLSASTSKQAADILVFLTDAR